MRTFPNARGATTLRWFALALVLLALAFALMSLWPDAAFAASAPRCSGASCRGKYPAAMGCTADAVTLAIKPQPGTAAAGYYQFTKLRYSLRCNAYWSQVNSRLAAGDILYTSAWIQGHRSATAVKKNGALIVNSRMWSGPSVACGVSVWKADPSYVVEGCAP